MPLSLSRFTALLLVTSAACAAADEPYLARPLTKAEPGATPFELLSPEYTGVQAVNLYNDPRMWGDRFREMTLGAVESGIAVADFDRDDRPDIFVVSKNGPCALYRQVAPFKFVDVSVPAGVDCRAQDETIGKTGVTVVDINQDGWPDIYICRYDAPNLLFINQGDGSFTEEAAARGLAIRDASVHAVFADYDRDGDLDAYLVTNILDFARSPQGGRDYLLRNDGNGVFSDATDDSGIWGLTQGHTAIWFDANGDGWPDLYVANDFETPDRFYLNRGDGTFVDVVDERLPHVTYFSMGADSGDLNGDGRIDFVVADMRDRTRAEYMIGMEEAGRGLWEMERVPDLIPQYMWNAVYLNSGTDRYLEAAHLLGMNATGWTWAVRLNDLDNDGWQDAFYTAGMVRNFIDADLVDRQNVAPTLAARAAVWRDAPVRNETTLALRNAGGLRFEDVSKKWGLDDSGVSFGCVQTDLDGDGDLDLVYSRYNAPPAIVRNNLVEGNRALIRLAGRAPNLEAVGAEILLESASGQQIRQLYGERGIVASEPVVAHFGLGQDDAIKRLTIRWPRGHVQVLDNLPANHLISVREPDLQPGAKPAPAVFRASPDEAAPFVETARAAGLTHVSRLRPFDEFKRQRLLPRRLNGLGPALAVADVDADGDDDVFVSGAGGQSGMLYLAQADGRFVPAPTQPWSEAAEADDVAAVWVDINGDGRPDLVLGAGGVEHSNGDPLMNDRLYLNEGQGRFVAAPPEMFFSDGISTGALAALDVDGDGKPELFVGARVTPGSYPEAPPSLIYRNENGRLVDATSELAPDLGRLGLVTAAHVADVDGDGRQDLVVAREWGPVTWLRNTGAGLEDRTENSGLGARTGWWSAVVSGDFDGDGRLDLAVGNVGLNTKYRASASTPTMLFAGDLDGRGKTDLVEAQYDGGRLYPLRGRSKLGYSFRWLPRKFPTFRAFAAAPLQEIFEPARLESVTRLAATELASGIFYQREPGQFTFVELPREAQLAPLHALVAADLDGDGITDLFGAGNNFGPEPNTGRFDGSLGILLCGDGRGGWRACAPVESGLVVSGEARSAALVKRPGAARPAVLVARVDGPLLFFVPQDAERPRVASAGK